MGEEAKGAASRVRPRFRTYQVRVAQFNTQKNTTDVTYVLSNVFFRLVRGEGEIVEEIVSRDRQREINRVRRKS